MIVRELPRRSFLAGGLAASSLVLVACTSDDRSPEETIDNRVDDSVLSFLIATFPDGFSQPATLAAGVEQRVAFVVADQIDNLRETAPTSLALAITRGDTTVFEMTVERRIDGIITPYYPARVTFAEPGQYRAVLPDYPDVAPVDFLVAEADTVEIPQVGEPLPAVRTPTTADPLGVAQLCTRAVPCPFHEHDLAAVVGNGRPTVLLVASPGFCQTDICGPVVDLLMEVGGERPDLDLIHCEVYDDPSVFGTGRFPDLVSAVEQLALPFEPALFVTDADGIIVARLDTTFDRSELADALQLI